MTHDLILASIDLPELMSKKEKKSSNRGKIGYFVVILHKTLFYFINIHSKYAKIAVDIMNGI